MGTFTKISYLGIPKIYFNDKSVVGKLVNFRFFIFRNSVQQTCPICREQLKTPNDSWVIQEIPGTEDMSQDMYHSLLTLIQNQTPTT